MTYNQRSFTMSRIRARDSKPEKTLRSLLHRNGFRFRKNVKGMPGTPDIVLPRYKTVIFVNGCFWHQHSGCPNSTMPKSNQHYWEEKLKNNINRDKANSVLLQKSGWQVITVWECEINSNIERIYTKIKHELC